MSQVLVTLANYTGPPNTLYKDIEIRSRRTIEGTFRSPYSLMNPTITIETTNNNSFRKSNIYDSNYVVIQTGGETFYYYIVDWSMINSDLIEISLKLDVLKTYEGYIREMEITLERSTLPTYTIPGMSSTGGIGRDGLIPNPTKQLRLAPNVSYHNFPRGFDDRESAGTYILVTAQNGYSPV